jgi:hypothetical protein
MGGRLTCQVLTALFLTVPVWGDTVTLKNGAAYQGTFISATGDQITLQIDKNTRRRLNVNDVARVTFDRPPAPGSRSRSSNSSSAIEDKYAALSGAQASLGSATSAEQPTADGRGHYRPLSAWSYLSNAAGRVCSLGADL